MTKKELRGEHRKMATALVVLYVCVIGAIVTTALMWADLSKNVSINANLLHTVIESRKTDFMFYEAVDTVHREMLRNDSIILSNQEYIIKKFTTR